MKTGIGYRDIERGLQEVAAKFPTVNIPGRSPFRGNNFMTSDIICRRKLKNGIWFELSYGKGFSTPYILGVTLIDSKGKSLEDLQDCCYEFSEVETILDKANKLKP